MKESELGSNRHNKPILYQYLGLETIDRRKKVKHWSPEWF